MKLWSSGELASHDFPTPTFLVDPMIPLGGTMLLHGKPNVGKTQLIMTMACCINAGVPLFGRWPVRQGPVVVIQADMTGQLQQLRVRKIVDRLNIEDTYWVVDEEGGTPQDDITKLDTREPRLVDDIRKVEPSMVVWDSLRKIHTLDENSSETPVKVVKSAQALFPKSTSSFVHHDKKETGDPDLEVSEDERFRGASGWKADVDTTMQLRSVGSRVPPRVLLDTHKARTAPPEEKKGITLQLDPETMLLLPASNSPTSEAKELFATEGYSHPAQGENSLVTRALSTARVAKTEIRYLSGA